MKKKKMIVSITIDPDLRDEIKKAAEKSGRSLSAEIAHRAKKASNGKK